MDLTDFLAAGPNLPFLVAGCVVLALLVLTIISMILGVGHDLFHADVDFTADLNGNGIPDYLEVGHFNIMSWVNPGRVPSTVLLLVLCGFYSILGYSVQWIYLGASQKMLPAMLVGPIVLVVALLATRITSNAIAPVMPKDETNAIALESLVGSSGVLSAGPITNTRFGVARFTDQYGTNHNLMVSGEGEETIANGSAVVLLGPHREREIAFVVRKI